MLASSAKRVLRPRASLLRRCFSSSGDGYPPYILNAPATEISTLPNGLRVASEGSHGETATVGVWIDAGSRYETPENNGVAHFLEHMAFKGTDKRTQQQLEVEIENMGGHLNAYTSREQTVYFAQVFKDDVPRAVEILGDMLLNPKLDASAIDKERSVITRELEEVNHNTEEVIFDTLHETAFPTSSLGKTILGPVENINSITGDQLRNHIDTLYTGPRMVVAGAGNIDHNQLSDLALEHFGKLPSSPPAGAVVPDETPRFVGSELRYRDDAMPVAHVAVSVESAGWTSPHAFPLMVMQSLLGSWDRMSSSGQNMNSELAQAAAAGQLCHSFSTFNTCYKDTGLFGVYFVADPKSTQDMAFQTMENLVRLCHNVNEDEVARAKAQLKANMLMMLDGTTPTCEEIGRQMLTYGRRISPAEVFARIDAVDVESINDCARTFINDQEPAVAAIGNVWELPDYNWWRRHTFWLRY
jgi:processing peptidase subunit beta